MRKLLLHTLFLISLHINLFAGGNISPAGAESAGLCRSSTALKGFWGIMNNQAGMSLLSKPTVAFSYENMFLLKETSNGTAAFAYPTNFGVIGATFNYFGYSKYNEMKVGLAYGRAFGKYIRIGLQLDYLKTTVSEGYGSKSNVTFELGVQSDVTRNLTLGAYVFNPVLVKLSDYGNERIPAVYRFGAAWHFSENFFATVECEKNSFYPEIIIRGGAEYNLKNTFFFRVGTSNGPEVFSLGFGMKLKNLKIDLASTMHRSLGFTPQTTLSYSF